MKTAIVLVLCVAVALAQPIPSGQPPQPPCPTGVDQTKCDAFYACMPKPPAPPAGPPPAPGSLTGQTPPPPPDPSQMQAQEAQCYQTAGMTAADQQLMIASRPQPPTPGQGPPPPMNGQGPPPLPVNGQVQSSSS